MVGVVIRLGKMVENDISSVCMVCDISMSHILQRSHNRTRQNHLTSRDVMGVTREQGPYSSF